MACGSTFSSSWGWGWGLEVKWYLDFFEELSAIIKDFEKNFGYNQYLHKKLLGALGYNQQFRLACANFSEKLAPSARISVH